MKLIYIILIIAGVLIGGMLLIKGDEIMQGTISVLNKAGHILNADTGNKELSITIGNKPLVPFYEPYTIPASYDENGMIITEEINSYTIEYKRFTEVYSIDDKLNILRNGQKVARINVSVRTDKREIDVKALSATTNDAITSNIDKVVTSSRIKFSTNVSGLSNLATTPTRDKLENISYGLVEMDKEFAKQVTYSNGVYYLPEVKINFRDIIQNETLNLTSKDNKIYISNVRGNEVYLDPTISYNYTGAIDDIMIQDLIASGSFEFGSLLKFNLDALPKEISILNAQLGLFTNQIATTNNPMYISNCTNITWSENAFSDGNIVTAGCKINGNTSTATANAWEYWNATAEVNASFRTSARNITFFLNMTTIDYTSFTDSNILRVGRNTVSPPVNSVIFNSSEPNDGLSKPTLNITLNALPGFYNITDCKTIYFEGNYFFNRSFNFSSAAGVNCINITVSNVSINGMGYTIRGLNKTGSWAISEVGTSATNKLQNITITNVSVKHFTYGIMSWYLENSSIIGNGANDQNSSGIYIFGSRNINVSNNNLTNINSSQLECAMCLYYSRFINVTNNTFYYTRTGISTNNLSLSTITLNNISLNNTGTASSSGIVMQNYSNKNNITYNNFWDIGNAMFARYNSSFNKYYYNNFSGNVNGILLSNGQDGQLADLNPEVYINSTGAIEDATVSTATGNVSFLKFNLSFLTSLNVQSLSIVEAQLLMQGYHSGAAGTVGQNVYIGNCTNISWYETNMNASGFVSAAQNCLTSGNYTAGVPATGINWIVLNATDYVNGTWLTGTSEKNLTLFINRTGNAIGAGTRNVQANILTIGLRTGTAASSEDQFNSTEATDGKSLPTLVVYYKVYQDGTKQVNYRNVIENNTFFNITGSAIRIDQSSFANVSGNLINNSWNGNAIFGQYTHNATIYNNSIFDSSLYGFICDNCSQNNVTNNTFQNSSQSNTVKVGVRLTNDSKKNQIWNNLFNLSNWSFQNSKNENYFNSTPTTAKGKNIVGNTSIAGNAWTNITGDGYSNTCTDGNNDGICDNNFNITTNDTAFKSYDKSPLKITGVSVVNPCSCPTADTNWNLRNAICLLNTFCDIQDGNTTLENSSLKIEYPGSLNCYSISWNETDSNITWNEATTNLSWRSG